MAGISNEKEVNEPSIPRKSRSGSAADPSTSMVQDPLVPFANRPYVAGSVPTAVRVVLVVAMISHPVGKADEPIVPYSRQFVAVESDSNVIGPAFQLDVPMIRDVAVGTTLDPNPSRRVDVSHFALLWAVLHRFSADDFITPSVQVQLGNKR